MILKRQSLRKNQSIATKNTSLQQILVDCNNAVILLCIFSFKTNHKMCKLLQDSAF